MGEEVTKPLCPAFLQGFFVAEIHNLQFGGGSQ